ncbi:aliphatic sulfonate ABC transporter substrate-binding protein [Inquilinus sp. Marseille-Q2685]|uniref:aliphatic sulfonate ABC transporter substrate-binding protein n=1 Tax=Inquilinus sp. Marseille-Q2685 TaxID=2866581 RepID=UPI001CE473B6|nr:aliphatic sulfonate ABC transporter substrate-binding protein [Inquilinus sp. Marseille-Q2685]
MTLLSRRTFAALLAGAGALAALPSAALADDTPKELRIGFQKVGLLVVARQQKLVEARLEPLGVKVSWVEFATGPALLEALNAGSLDFGYTGDGPPIFAQAAGIPFVYVAAIPPTPQGEAIIVKEASPIRSVADLKGKRIGLAKGTSSHNLTAAALEKAGIAFGDITPVYLGPADAAAAFDTDQFDAWTIWDPFLALAQQRTGVRVVAWTGEVLQAAPFLLAHRDYADAHPKTIRLVLDALTEAAAWANGHRDELAKAMAAVTGVDLAAQTVAAQRGAFGVLPLDGTIVANQQESADRFHRLGLIPEAITVRDNVWTPPQG